jgi:phosphoribosyl 1,2-cyclic phosphodiesterase
VEGRGWPISRRLIPAQPRSILDIGAHNLARHYREGDIAYILDTMFLEDIPTFNSQLTAWLILLLARPRYQLVYFKVNYC